MSTHVRCPHCQNEVRVERTGVNMCPVCGGTFRVETITGDASIGPEVQAAELITPVEHEVPKDFSTTSGIGKLISGIGWVIVVLAIVAGGFYIFAREGADYAIPAGIAMMASGAISGLVLVVLGQLLQMQVSLVRYAHDLSQTMAALAVRPALPAPPVAQRVVVPPPRNVPPVP